jgi:uncharacterized protein DUF4262
MCWQCDHPGATTEDFLEEVRSTIRRNGWAVQYVEDDRIPFSYTVGLHEAGLPELLATGLSPELAARMLNAVARYMAREVVPAPGERVRLSDRWVCEVVEVAQPDAHLNFAVALYGPDVRALQLVWADAQGNWPWAAEFNAGRGRQPVLGVRSQNA